MERGPSLDLGATLKVRALAQLVGWCLVWRFLWS